MDVLMIHDVKKEYFDLPLDRYRLTFDDGLYSQYYYHPLLRNFSEPLLFFITTALIREAPARPQFAGRFLDPVKSGVYSYRAHIEQNLESFMTLEEVRCLAEQPNVRLGAHSHFHDLVLTDVHPRKPKPISPWKSARFRDVPEPLRRGLSIRSRLAFQGLEFRQGRLRPRPERDWLDYIRRDTELCQRWFEKHLGRVPKAYCFPFNEYSPPLIEILRSCGFEQFYASRSPKDPRIIGRTDIDSLAPAPASQADDHPGD